MNERAKKKYHYKRSARVWLELGTAASPELSDNFWRVISRDGANITDIIGSKGGWKKKLQSNDNAEFDTQIRDYVLMVEVRVSK